MRYNLMSPSSERSSETKQPYPDTLSANYDNFVLVNPSELELSTSTLERLDIVASSIYGSMNYMDIFLEINDVEHRSVLSAGDTLLVPSKSQLDAFILERRVNAVN